MNEKVNKNGEIYGDDHNKHSNGTDNDDGDQYDVDDDVYDSLLLFFSTFNLTQKEGRLFSFLLGWVGERSEPTF